MPQTQTAVIVSKDSVNIVHDLEIPSPGNDEVLIKNVAVAANPKDFKVPVWTGLTLVEGNDVAGHVEAVGKDVKEFKKGDKVAAFTYMAKANVYGAYQQYSLSPFWTVFPLGPKTTFEAASTLPLAYMTAVIGLFVKLGLPEPPESGDIKKVEEKEKIPVVVYGGGSSVGAYAIQLAKRAGFFVITVVGSSSALAKRLGADAIINYRDHSTPEDLASAIVAANPDQSSKPIKHVYDAITEISTTKTSVQVVAKSGSGGVVTTVLPDPSDVPNPLPDGVVVARTMVGTAHAPWDSDPHEDKELAKKYYRLVGKWIEEGKFEPNVVKLLPNGLNSVEEGLKLLKEGKVSGEKLVYRIADTPGLQA